MGCKVLKNILGKDKSKNREEVLVWSKKSKKYVRYQRNPYKK